MEILKKISILAIILLLSGCNIQMRQYIKERVDQEIKGNRGYVRGNIPSIKEGERKKTRTITEVSIDLPPCPWHKISEKVEEE